MSAADPWSLLSAWAPAEPMRFEEAAVQGRGSKRMAPRGLSGAFGQNRVRPRGLSRGVSGAQRPSRAHATSDPDDRPLSDLVPRACGTAKGDSDEDALLDALEACAPDPRGVVAASGAARCARERSAHSGAPERAGIEAEGSPRGARPELRDALCCALRIGGPRPDRDAPAPTRAPELVVIPLGAPGAAYLRHESGALAAPRGGACSESSTESPEGVGSPQAFSAEPSETVSELGALPGSLELDPFQAGVEDVFARIAELCQKREEHSDWLRGLYAELPAMSGAPGGLEQAAAALAHCGAPDTACAPFLLQLVPGSAALAPWRRALALGAAPDTGSAPNASGSGSEAPQAERLQERARVSAWARELAPDTALAPGVSVCRPVPASPGAAPDTARLGLGRAPALEGQDLPRLVPLARAPAAPQDAPRPLGVSLRVLLCGDLHGRFSFLRHELERRAAAGQCIDLVLAAGKCCPEDIAAAKDFDDPRGAHQREFAQVSTPVYFVDSSNAELIALSTRIGRPLKLGSSVFFLGGCGAVFVHGLRVAFLSGRFDEEDYSCRWGCGDFVAGSAHYTANALDEARRQGGKLWGDARRSGPLVDLLMTSEWPQGHMAEEASPQATRFASPAVSDLLLSLRPRHHVCASADLYYCRDTDICGAEGVAFRCTSIALAHARDDDMRQVGRRWCHLLSLQAQCADSPGAADIAVDISGLLRPPLVRPLGGERRPLDGSRKARAATPEVPGGPGCVGAALPAAQEQPLGAVTERGGLSCTTSYSMALPPGWSCHASKRRGVQYFHHKESGRSMWKFPSG